MRWKDRELSATKASKEAAKEFLDLISQHSLGETEGNRETSSYIGR
jgi:hypothetical protein